MPRLKIYLETTVFNYYFLEDTYREKEIISTQKVEKWKDMLFKPELCVKNGIKNYETN